MPTEAADARITRSAPSHDTNQVENPYQVQDEVSSRQLGCLRQIVGRARQPHHLAVAGRDRAMESQALAAPWRASQVQANPDLRSWVAPCTNAGPNRTLLHLCPQKVMILAGRKPRLSSRNASALPLRPADRANVAVSLKLPPRLTRAEDLTDRRPSPSCSLP
jgi:hypothetical protein